MDVSTWWGFRKPERQQQYYYTPRPSRCWENINTTPRPSRHVVAKVRKGCVAIRPTWTLLSNPPAAKLDDVTRILSDLQAELDANKLSVERTPLHATRLGQLLTA